MRTASWVIVRIDDNKAVGETFSAVNANIVNNVSSTLKAVPALEWLSSLSNKST